MDALLQIREQRHAQRLLALAIQTDGGAPRRMGTEFHQRAQGDLGKGRRTPALIGFDDAHKVLRRVAHAPSGTINADKTQQAQGSIQGAVRHRPVDAASPA